MKINLEPWSEPGINLENFLLTIRAHVRALEIERSKSCKFIVRTGY
ncbi:hypothetical protein LEP1GSC050_4112 [Leptospira broomii serovar Hurstbridge str. 5399]|uniref:Uncharacterized protein n=1 Tax=Leptospira broomii serovar Hurstbridge str. 5399 TaxID=1049789 RepID=T0GD10_9LEPT|nr:hypothetical protein LEP1GSC050_4112 [Leptospira broomii serovar Hurstbridge str. 5399]